MILDCQSTKFEAKIRSGFHGLLKSSMCFFSALFLSVSSEATIAGDGWFACAYWAQATENRLATITVDTDFIDAHLAALTLGKTLWTSEKKRMGIEGEFQIAKHLGKEFTCTTEACEKYEDLGFPRHSERQDHWEFNAVLILRWNEFPWDRYLDTSFAVGEGLSYATEYPPIEKDYHAMMFGLEDQVSKLLNYLSFELTFGVPKLPPWNVFIRIHHRSGIYGLINDVNGGSNYMGAGVRYDF